ncbi:MAG: DUF1905 domain-containing protein [Saprospiraceae bacterium]|nr:DUF1905 domain-containing protein [Saprospiraceae bacterium]
MDEQLLVNRLCLLEKFPGKGEWTYTKIPEVTQSKTTPFGWVTVQGSIDGFEIKHCKLMPFGDGSLFLPVRAEIRKKIGKQAGNYVQVILHATTNKVELPEELKQCLLDEPQAYEAFLCYSSDEQKSLINWIYSAKKEETRAARIANLLDKLIKK